MIISTVNLVQTVMQPTLLTEFLFNANINVLKYMINKHDAKIFTHYQSYLSIQEKLGKVSESPIFFVLCKY